MVSIATSELPKSKYEEEDKEGKKTGQREGERRRLG